MHELRFDGEVAIVTGAGGRPSLGRCYAHLLAARGAKVLVNDLGVGPDGRGSAPASAQAVAQEIRDAGGEAVADTHSVAEQETAARVVQTALDGWGRVDILVNNAGVAILAEFDEITATDIERMIHVHLLGNIWMTRAVWAHMKERGYGRIVNASSAAVLGLRYVTIYGAVKGAVLALTRGLAVEGRPHGIKVNAIGPSALTSAFELLYREGTDATAPPPELVAPVVAFLCHRQCPHNGGYFESAGGHTSMRRLVETRGYTNPALELEDVYANFAQIMSTEGMVLTPEPDENPIAEIIDPRPYKPA